VVFDDDHDHRTLDELEWHLSLEDPEFVGRFDRGQQRMSARFRHRRGNRIASSVALAVGVLLLLLGTPDGALAAMLTTGLVWLAWRYPDLFTGTTPS
jgi:hypothetical protein